jgi:hypothetical protein
LAGALCIGAALAVQPAVLAVRYAVASPQGGPLVAYWVALLATGLPAMHGIAATRRLPMILIRKVSVSMSDARIVRLHCIGHQPLSVHSAC